MSQDRNNVYRFRDKLIHMVSRTGYMRFEAMSEERVATVCEEMGITVDLYTEARLLYLKKINSNANATDSLGLYQNRGKRQNEAFPLTHMTVELKARILKEAEDRKISAGCLFRSLLHHYLKGSWEPDRYIDTWYIGAAPAKRGEALLNFGISFGAMGALKERAMRLGTTRSTIARTLLLYMLDGKYAQPGTIQYIGSNQMYLSVEQYER